MINMTDLCLPFAVFAVVVVVAVTYIRAKGTAGSNPLEALPPLSLPPARPSPLSVAMAGGAARSHRGVIICHIDALLLCDVRVQLACTMNESVCLKKRVNGGNKQSFGGKGIVLMTCDTFIDKNNDR